jgi:hypothetical protein
MQARFLRYARVEPGEKSGYPFTLPVVGWLSQNRELVLPGGATFLVPGATILEIGDDGAISRVSYDEALPVRLTREFLAAPERLLRILLDDR